MRSAWKKISENERHLLPSSLRLWKHNLLKYAFLKAVQTLKFWIVGASHTLSWLKTHLWKHSSCLEFIYLGNNTLPRKWRQQNYAKSIKLVTKPSTPFCSFELLSCDMGKNVSVIPLVLEFGKSFQSQGLQDLHPGSERLPAALI